MAKIEVRFKRYSPALDENARARLCGSSGSEHSGKASADDGLSVLVDSFLERENGGVLGEQERDGGYGELREEEAGEGEGIFGSDSKKCCERERMVMNLIGGAEDGGVGRRIMAEIERAAWWRLGNGSPEVGLMKRQLMSWLRHKGLEAGLCKSRWEKTAQTPAGEHECIDILIAGSRYIVEISPATHFTIARPTDSYASLLQLFPRILVCKEEKMKTVARLMCAAMRESMKKRELHLPPWRRNAYVYAKWFGPYKRTTTENADHPAVKRLFSGTGKRLLGFEAAPMHVAHVTCCRGEMVRKVPFGFGL